MFLPDAMRHPPRLDDDLRTTPPSPRHALLINPFYPKDPHASFGKHVLTPSLALTSIAASTPPCSGRRGPRHVGAYQQHHDWESCVSRQPDLQSDC